MLNLRIVSTALILVLAAAALAGGEDPPRWTVTLDTSSLERVVLDPESILDDPEAFWASDGAYIRSKQWHDNVGLPLDYRGYYDKWLARLADLAAVPPADRPDSPGFAMLQAIRDRGPVFQARSVPLLTAMLPANGLEVATTLYITTGTLSYGFMTHGEVVTDVMSDYYGGDPDRIVNLHTHECFHVGYGWNRRLRTEIELEDGFLYNTLLDGLQNEGMATYVGWLAAEWLPAEGEQDYRMLDDPDEVGRHLAAVNGLLAAARTLPADSLRALAWDVGVMQRSYYVAGAHMARTIDRELGREALVGTVVTGPVGFVNTYNGLVADDLRVGPVPVRTGYEALESLKTAAVDGDVERFAAAAARMRASAGTLGPDTRRFLERFGYGCLRVEANDRAIAVFELGAQLYPDEPNAWDCLGEAHWKNGDAGRAIQCYEQALKLDPEFANAKRMLAEIGG